MTRLEQIIHTATAHTQKANAAVRRTAYQASIIVRIVPLYLGRRLSIITTLTDASFRSFSALLYAIGRYVSQHIVLLAGAIFSLAVIAFAARFYAANSLNLPLLEAYGSFTSGVLSSIVFIWVVVAGVLQHRQLKEAITTGRGQAAAASAAQMASRLSLMKDYQQLLMPYIYNDCRLLLRLAQSRGLVPAAAGASDKEFSESSLNEQCDYMAGHPDLTPFLEQLISGPGGHLVDGTARQLVVRVSAITGLIPSDLEEALIGSQLSVYKRVAEICRDVYSTENGTSTGSTA